MVIVNCFYWYHVITLREVKNADFDLLTSKFNLACSKSFLFYTY